MLEISIPLDINFSFDGEISINGIVEKIRNLEIENYLLNEIITKTDDLLVSELCGKKHKRYEEKKRYGRVGNYKREITTLLGKSVLKVNKIRDNLTGEIFKPILDLLGIVKYRNYQEDISFASCDIATKNSYRDTRYIMKNFLKKILSPSTINRRVKETGKEIKEYISDKNKNTGEKYEEFFADGTLSHSQEKGVRKNNIQVAIALNDKGEKQLLSCSVNKSWEEISQEINQLDVLSTNAVLISDAEQELIKSFKTLEKKYQLDLIHFIRDIGYKLWKDGKLKLENRKNIKKKVEKIVYKLKNQTLKYSNDKGTLKKKLDEAVDDLKDLSEYLLKCGCDETARFIKKHSNNIVTFVILAMEGKEIPWTSNMIERLMGEIQKRCKHKWMRWTTEGQEAILNMILTRYNNPEIYEEFKNHKLKTKNKNNITIKIINIKK